MHLPDHHGQILHLPKTNGISKMSTEYHNLGKKFLRISQLKSENNKEGTREQNDTY